MPDITKLLAKYRDSFSPVMEFPGDASKIYQLDLSVDNREIYDFDIGNTEEMGTYINRKIARVKFKEFGWQAFIAPIGPSLIIALIAWAWHRWAFPFLEGIVGTLVAGVISILFAFVFILMFTFFPLYSFFGGWDDNTFSIFKEAVRISGPSRFLFMPIVWSSNWLIKISPFHNKFVIKYELMYGFA